MSRVLKTLDFDEVLKIHEVLAADFAAADDPISPAGIKSRDLLESAVSRQFTGYGGRLKYPTAVQNAASLAYGICCNHPFHNGNKRTSLVALLCHLDRNDLTFEGNVSHHDLYDFILRVARHGFAARQGKGDQSDAEVEEMARWIRKRSRVIDRKERIITFRELARILSTFGYVLENFRANMCDVVRYDERRSWLGLRKRAERIRVTRMGYPGDGVPVSKGELHRVRQQCHLTDKDGVDAHAFYAKYRPTDYFVATYRGTLRRLARI